MLTLKINKEFLNNYRQYKIDLMEGILGEDICYKNLEHVLNNGKTLSYLISELSECYTYDLNVITSEIRNKRRKSESLQDSMAKQMVMNKRSSI